MGLTNHVFRDAGLEPTIDSLPLAHPRHEKVGSCPKSLKTPLATNLDQSQRSGSF